MDTLAYQLLFAFDHGMKVEKTLTQNLACQHIKIRLVATCHLQICYNLLKQTAENLWITSLNNRFATSVLTGYRKPC